MFFVIFQKIFWDTLLQTLYFPLWWYTGGIKYAATSCFNLLSAGNVQLAPGLWLKNIFVPMYGQYDIQGRIISFLMRLFQIIIRGFALFIWLIACFMLFFAWLLIPVVIGWGLITSLL